MRFGKKGILYRIRAIAPDTWVLYFFLGLAIVGLLVGIPWLCIGAIAVVFWVIVIGIVAWWLKDY